MTKLFDFGLIWQQHTTEYFILVMLWGLCAAFCVPCVPFNVGCYGCGIQYALFLYFSIILFFNLMLNNFEGIKIHNLSNWAYVVVFFFHVTRFLNK